MNGLKNCLLVGLLCILTFPSLSSANYVTISVAVNGLPEEEYNNGNLHTNIHQYCELQYIESVGMRRPDPDRLLYWHYDLPDKVLCCVFSIPNATEADGRLIRKEDLRAIAALQKNKFHDGLKIDDFQYSLQIRSNINPKERLQELMFGAFRNISCKCTPKTNANELFICYVLHPDYQYGSWEYPESWIIPISRLLGMPEFPQEWQLQFVGVYWKSTLGEGEIVHFDTVAVVSPNEEAPCRKFVADPQFQNALSCRQRQLVTPGIPYITRLNLQYGKPGNLAQLHPTREFAIVLALNSAENACVYPVDIRIGMPYYEPRKLVRQHDGFGFVVSSVRPELINASKTLEGRVYVCRTLQRNSENLIQRCDYYGYQDGYLHILVGIQPTTWNYWFTQQQLMKRLNAGVGGRCEYNVRMPKVEK